MATDMTSKKRLLLVKTALKLLIITSRILPQWFCLHGTMTEIFIAILSRENRASCDFQRLPRAVFTVQCGFLRLLTSSIWNYLVFVRCQLREIYCSGILEDCFLPTANFKVVFYVFSLHIHIISLKTLFMSF